MDIRFMWLIIFLVTSPCILALRHKRSLDNFPDKEHSKRFVYDYDEHHKRYLLCKFASTAQIQKRPNDIVPLCKQRNKGLMMRRGGTFYLPYFGSGSLGILLRCENPKNVTLYNCTNEYIIHSVCKYSCLSDLVATDITTECTLAGPNTNISAAWANRPLCIESKADKDDEVKSKDNESSLYWIIVAVIFVIIVVVYLCWKNRHRQKCQKDHQMSSMGSSISSQMANKGVEYVPHKKVDDVVGDNKSLLKANEGVEDVPHEKVDDVVGDNKSLLKGKEVESANNGGNYDFDLLRKPQTAFSDLPHMGVQSCEISSWNDSSDRRDYQICHENLDGLSLDIHSQN